MIYQVIVPIQLAKQLSGKHTIIKEEINYDKIYPINDFALRRQMGMANYQQNYQREQTGMVIYYQMGTCIIIPLALVLAASE